MTKQRQILGLLVWLVICYSASAVGAVASIQASSFYAELVQPSWAPPSWLFGPVWTLLYGMMAVSVWLIWRSEGFKANRMAISWFFFQLLLNSLWSWLFFGWHLGAFSFVEIIFLWVAIVATIICFWRVRPVAGALLIPYLLWVSFASALNYAMWQLNPDVLG